MSPTLSMNPKRKHKRKLLILPMVKSHYPRCLQCFPTQENLTTKTLNPKVTSFVIQVSLTSSSPSKSAKKHLYIVHSNRRNRAAPVNNRVTIEAYDTRYNDLIQKSCHASAKSCHDFPLAETIHSAKIVTRHIKNRATIMSFQHHKNEGKLQHI